VRVAIHRSPYLSAIASYDTDRGRSVLGVWSRAEGSKPRKTAVFGPLRPKKAKKRPKNSVLGLQGPLHRLPASRMIDLRTGPSNIIEGFCFTSSPLARRHLELGVL